jgi:hypothetical protein
MVDRRLGDGVLDVVFFARHIEGIPVDVDGLRSLKGLLVVTSADYLYVLCRSRGEKSVSQVADLQLVR